MQDFSHVNKRALENIISVLSYYLPNGKWQGHEYIALNPTRNDNKLGSFSINANTGEWADFATNDAGGDIISLVAYLEKVNQGHAKTALAKFLGIPNKRNVTDVETVTSNTKPRSSNASGEKLLSHTSSSDNVTPVAKQNAIWTVISPIPKNAPPPPSHHPQLGKILQQYIYRTQNEKIICYVCRFEIITDGKPDKTFRPLTYCRSKTGREAWQWLSPPELRTLYNLDIILAHPEKPIVFCEGEKSADAAARLLPDFVTTTTLNGAKSPHKTDLSHLKGRELIIWADNDPTGQWYAAKIASLATQAGAASINTIDLKKFQRLPGASTQRDLPDKWDAADALEEGYTAEHMKILLQDPGFLVNQRPMEHDSKAATSESYTDLQNSSKPHYTNIKTAGIFYHGVNVNGQLLPPRKICSALEVTALTRDEDSNNWGRLLEFVDRDNVPHKYALPMELMSGDGNEYRKELLRSGLEIERSPGINHLLDNYINQASPQDKVICTSRIGWHKAAAFVLPNLTIGASGEKIIFQSAATVHHNFKQKGTLEDWQLNVSRYCSGNSRLVFAACTAFAATLLHFIGEGSAGFNFTGSSSCGKTTALRVAASICGDPEYTKRWRATSNGLEGMAHMHNHMLLILDELAQVDPEEAGEIAYMLANEQGKVRAQKSGLTRALLGWRLLFLSAGEVSLGEHMLAVNKKVKAGQEVRLIDIPADAGSKLGLFENLHGFNNGAEFSRALVQATQEYYGTAIIQWLEKLATFVTDADNINIMKKLQREFIQCILPHDPDGQVIRVASTMALIATAGELATNIGITGWDDGESINSIKKCFHDWVEQRGGAGNQEAANILAQVRSFFETYGDSNFMAWDCNDSHTTYERLGFNRADDQTDNTTYYVFTEAYKQRICKGFNQRTVTKLLLEKGWLKPGPDGTSQSVRLPGIGTTRCYVFSNQSWED